MPGSLRAFAARPVLLDVQTLLIVTLIDVFAVAVAVPAVMGWRVSQPARHVIGSAVLQALGWGSFLLASRLDDRIFSTLWIGLLASSFLCTWHALDGWLGPRPLRRAMHAITVLTPLGYALVFDHYAWRTGWSNLGLALLLVGVCIACLTPAPHAGRRWRGLIVVCLGSLAALLLARGVLGMFFTEVLPTLRTPNPVNVIAGVMNSVAVTLTTLALLVGWHEEAERDLRERADTDSLTGLLNRRAFAQRADEAITMARRYRTSLALLVIDVDHFKRINDSAGHDAGDEALRRVASAMRQQSRTGDLLCRWGGEEFCLLLHRADADAAAEVDKRLRAALLHASRAGEGALRYSAGLALLRPGDQTVREMLRRADKALYEAKAGGRDRLVVAEPRPVPAPLDAAA